MAEKNPARTGAFEVTIRLFGLGGHSSTPYKTHNPIIAGFAYIHTVTERLWYEFDSFDNVALYPVNISAGTKANIIPEFADVTLRGEYVTEKQSAHLKNVIETSLQSLETLYHFTTTISYTDGFVKAA